MLLGLRVAVREQWLAGNKHGSENVALFALRGDYF